MKPEALFEPRLFLRTTLIIDKGKCLPQIVTHHSISTEVVTKDIDIEYQDIISIMIREEEMNEGARQQKNSNDFVFNSDFSSYFQSKFQFG